MTNSHDTGPTRHDPGPPAESRCPRCGGTFHCGANDAAPCACTTVRLDAATLAALRGRYAGCLCLRCLGALAGAAAMKTAGAVE